jgi:hypothetical protein
MKLASGKYTFHLSDHKNTVIPKEFLLRETNVKDRVEKCIANLGGT